jgi:hypothetical protein
MSQQSQKRKDAEASAKNDEAFGAEDIGKAAFDTSKSRDDLSRNQEEAKGYTARFENGFVDGPDGRGKAKGAQADAKRDSNLNRKPNPAQTDQSNDTQ